MWIAARRVNSAIFQATFPNHTSFDHKNGSTGTRRAHAHEVEMMTSRSEWAKLRERSVMRGMVLHCWWFNYRFRMDKKNPPGKRLGKTKGSQRLNEKCDFCPHQSVFASRIRNFYQSSCFCHFGDTGNQQLNSPTCRQNWLMTVVSFLRLRGYRQIALW